MTEQSKYYEDKGDSLGTPNAKLQAYRVAQSNLNQSHQDYHADWHRLQSKITAAIETINWRTAQ